MTSIALRALRTVGALALALAAASPTLAFNPQPDPPVCSLGCSLPDPHNPPDDKANSR
jgi:hypothetical protein